MGASATTLSLGAFVWPCVSHSVGWRPARGRTKLTKEILPLNKCRSLVCASDGSDGTVSYVSRVRCNPPWQSGSFQLSCSKPTGIVLACAIIDFNVIFSPDTAIFQVEPIMFHMNLQCIHFLAFLQARLPILANFILHNVGPR